MKRVTFLTIGVLLAVATVVSIAHAETWQELLAQADSLRTAGQYDTALALAQQAFEITERDFGKVDTATGNALAAMGNLNCDLGQYAVAESLETRALSIRETVLGPNHPSVANSLNILGVVNMRTANWVAADSFLTRAMRIRIQCFGENDLSVAASLNNLAVMYYYQRKLSEAGATMERALAIQEKVLGKDDIRVAQTLNNLAFTYRDLGHLDQAEPFAQRALAIRESVLPPGHATLGESFLCMARMRDDQGKYEEALYFEKRALAVYEAAFGGLHPLVASTHGMLGAVYARLGRFAQAQAEYEKALEIREQTLGPNHRETLEVLSNLAATYNEQARYAEGEALLNRVLAAVEANSGAESLDMTAPLENLAVTYVMEGRYAEAEQAVRRALAIFEKQLGSEEPLQFAVDLSNLSQICVVQGRLVEAQSLLERALAIQERALGLQHPDVANTLSYLANVCMVQGDNGRADSLFRLSLSITQTALGSDSPDYGRLLWWLGNFYDREGKFREADSLLRQGLDVCRAAFGPQHPKVAEAFNRLALHECAQEHFAEAETAEAEAWRIRCQLFRDVVPAMTERQALQSSQLLNDETASYLSVLLASSDRVHGNSDTVARVVFATKGRIADGIMARNRALDLTDDSEATAYADSLRDARFALSRLYANGPGEDSVSAYRSKLQMAAAKKDRLEAELARRSASFARDRELWDIDGERVAAALPEGTALVEFMRYDHGKGFKDKEPRYLAIMLKHGGAPVVFPLGAATAIDTAISYYRQQFRNVQNLDKAAYITVSDNLYSLVWRPFAALLAEASTVFIAPDGNLNLVSFAGLLDDNGKYLIEKFPIQYLSSGRDLLRLKETAPSGTGLLAMGDPDFNLSFQDASTASLSVPLVLSILYLRSSCAELNKLNVPPLPATRREVESVVSQWNVSRTEPATVDLGVDATEEHFKQESSGKRVLHLATHGFYISDECKPKQTTRSALRQEEGFVGENPFLQCGLLLAGANKHGEGAAESNREDGIVTAEDVAGLNLNGTDLVVLSACETGLGEVKSGEGVYGLRRAFQMAGARTVISALWPIDDQATAEFMGQLFTAQDESLPQTMQRIALSRISALRSQGKSDHPFFWAAFVATGDWKAH